MNENFKESGAGSILVTGDFIVDRNLLPGLRIIASDNPAFGTRFIDVYGGSILTFDLINSLIRENNIKSINCIHGLKEPSIEEFILKYPERTAFTIWSKGKTSDSWKIDEIRGYGYDPDDRHEYHYTDNESIKPTEWIVIDDGNLGFRNSEEVWPDFKDKMVIIKCSYPFFEGKLFHRLTMEQQRPEKLIVILTLSNLRKSDVKISSDISWEQTAFDITSEFKRNSKLNSILQKSDHLIVMAGTSGAVHFHNNVDRKTEISIVFDPTNIEGEWEKATPLIPGSGSCFLASFSTSLVNLYLSRQIDTGSIENCINKALNTTRIFCRAGFLPDDFKNKVCYMVTDHEHKFVKQEDMIFSKAYVPSPFNIANEPGISSRNKGWTILRGNYIDSGSGDKVEDYIDLACELAIKGSNILMFAPVMSFGKIVSFDRPEIEGYRNIKKLLVDFACNKQATKPLNIAVFGAPGSGKSFAVKEMSNSFLKIFKPEKLEFNLSQFKDASELAGAFNAIRDSVLKGNLPVVFWDEFDSEGLLWLKSLIAPMQDGSFQDGKDTHPIGKSIFIFAGGTSSTFDQFDPRNMGDNKADAQRINDFIKVKGPDFVSRINGYLNVCGPNPLKLDMHDVTYPIRRALFIRTSLGLAKDDQLDIDFGLLRALLLVKVYNNGARSLDRILTHLKMSRSKRIVRSDLPSDEVINMNTDLDDFYSIMYDENLNSYKNVSSLSAFFHEKWMKKKATLSEIDKAFFMMSNEQRLTNISTAGRIKDILASTGKFALVEENSEYPDCTEEFVAYISIEKNLEKMAEQEHLSWSQSKKHLGWKKGKHRSDYFKVHPFIDEPYEKLSEEDKNKDRKQIRSYCEYLKGSGFKIISLK
jgi:hypothetical protein